MIKPTAFPQFGTETFKTMLEANLAGMEALQRQFASLEKTEYEKAQASIDEGAKLMKQSLELWRSTAVSWRDEALAAQKQLSESLMAAL